jgi:hypothetical protein
MSLRGQSGRLLNGSIGVALIHRYCIESNTHSVQGQNRRRLTRQFSLLTTPARGRGHRTGPEWHSTISVLDGDEVLASTIGSDYALVLPCLAGDQDSNLD